MTSAELNDFFISNVFFPAPGGTPVVNSGARGAGTTSNQCHSVLTQLIVHFGAPLAPVFAQVDHCVWVHPSKREQVLQD